MNKQNKKKKGHGPAGKRKVATLIIVFSFSLIFLPIYLYSPKTSYPPGLIIQVLALGPQARAPVSIVNY